MSSIMYGCIGSPERHKKGLNDLERYLSRDGKYNIQNISRPGLFAGNVNLDNRTRCAFLPQYNLTVLVNGYVYGPLGPSCSNDLELLASSYLRLKQGLACEIDGPFAALIYDHGSNEALICNDMFGLQPLFYTVVDGSLFFGSEAESLVKAGIVGPSLDHNALAELFVTGSTIGGSTLFKDVQRLPHNSVLIWNKGGVKLVRNRFRFKKGISGKDRQSRRKKIDQLLVESLSKIGRYLNNEPFSLCLSGGFDSRLLLYAAIKGKLNFKAITYRDPLLCLGSDVEYAQLLAEKFGFEHEIRDEDEGYMSKYDTLLNSVHPNNDRLVLGSGGEHLRGKMLKRARYLDQIDPRSILSRVFTQKFIGQIDRDPVETMKREIDLIDCDDPLKRNELYILHNYSSFFRRDNPTLHRLNNMFLRDNHLPFFNKDLIMNLIDVPEEELVRSKLAIRILERYHPEMLSVPSNSSDLSYDKKAFSSGHGLTSYERRYMEYYDEFHKFSPFWEHGFLTGSFDEKEETMTACFLMIWHDEYFGHTGSVARMKEIERRCNA